jgi:hypothetical protein
MGLRARFEQGGWRGPGVDSSWVPFEILNHSRGIGQISWINEGCTFFCKRGSWAGANASKVPNHGKVALLWAWWNECWSTKDWSPWTPRDIREDIIWVIVRINALPLWDAIGRIQGIVVAWLQCPAHGKAQKREVILAFGWGQRHGFMQMYAILLVSQLRMELPKVYRFVGKHDKVLTLGTKMKIHPDLDSW